MASAAAWAVVSAVTTTAATLYTTNVARQGRRDTQSAQNRQQSRIRDAEKKKKEALRRREGILGERRKERASEGFGSTIVAGKAKSLGGSGTGGQSLLG